KGKSEDGILSTCFCLFFNRPAWVSCSPLYFCLLPFYFCLMKIVPISLPTPFYVGPVNVYLVAEEPVTLIDTGPKTKEASEALKEGLRRARLRISDIRRIVLTHAHEDHCGLAKALRDEAKDAQVFVHSWETGHRAGRLEYEE